MLNETIFKKFHFGNMILKKKMMIFQVFDIFQFHDEIAGKKNVHFGDLTPLILEMNFFYVVRVKKMFGAEELFWAPRTQCLNENSNKYKLYLKNIFFI